MGACQAFQPLEPTALEQPVPPVPRLQLPINSGRRASRRTSPRRKEEMSLPSSARLTQCSTEASPRHHSPERPAERSAMMGLSEPWNLSNLGPFPSVQLPAAWQEPAAVGTWSLGVVVHLAWCHREGNTAGKDRFEVSVAEAVIQGFLNNAGAFRDHLCFVQLPVFFSLPELCLIRRPISSSLRSSNALGLTPPNGLMQPQLTPRHLPFSGPDWGQRSSKGVFEEPWGGQLAGQKGVEFNIHMRIGDGPPIAWAAWGVQALIQYSHGTLRRIPFLEPVCPAGGLQHPDVCDCR